jgi:hypothetical protein
VWRRCGGWAPDPGATIANVRLRTRKLAPAIAALGAAGLLSGCGHTHRVGANRSVQMTLTEYRLRPHDLSVSAGTLAILVHNYGRLTHNLAVTEAGQLVATTDGILPGQSAELDLSLAPGRYQMSSTILSDESLGLYGTLSVN